MKVEIIISISAVAISIIALIISFTATRYQFIAMINNQLADKAKECNSYLDEKDNFRIPRNEAKISGIISSIITAEELLNYQICFKKSIFIKCLDAQSLIDQYYLQLHTTIRVFLQKRKFEKNDLDEISQFEIIERQYKRTIEFLTKSIIKDFNNDFEKLHECSRKRNK